MKKRINFYTTRTYVIFEHISWMPYIYIKCAAHLLK